MIKGEILTAVGDHTSLNPSPSLVEDCQAKGRQAAPSRSDAAQRKQEARCISSEPDCDKSPLLLDTVETDAPAWFPPSAHP